MTRRASPAKLYAIRSRSLNSFVCGVGSPFVVSSVKCFFVPVHILEECIDERIEERVG